MFQWLQTADHSRWVELLTFHCKVSELLLLCASFGGKGLSGAQLWVVKLTGSEQDPFTELYIAYTLKKKITSTVSGRGPWQRQGFYLSFPPGLSREEHNPIGSTYHDSCSLLVLSWPNYGESSQQGMCFRLLFTVRTTQPHSRQAGST